MDTSPVTVVTWNVLGRTGFDTDGIAAVLRAAAPDVIALQEVGWTQARSLSRRLGMGHRWAFKHLAWPQPEGLAVLTPHRILGGRSFVIRREPLWSWRRRIALTVQLERDDGERFALIDIHLSAHAEGEPQRRQEAAAVVAAARGLPQLPVITGDCNDEADGAGPAELSAAGWIDAWPAAGRDGDGATNWTAGERRGRLPTQRLDYVFAPPGWTVADCAVLAESNRLDWFADESDHLPVVAVLRPPESVSA